MNTEIQDQITETDEPSELESASAKAVSTLFGIGRLWAAHGLGVGRSAISATASIRRTSPSPPRAERPSEPREPEPRAQPEGARVPDLDVTDLSVGVDHEGGRERVHAPLVSERAALIVDHREGELVLP